MSRDSLKCAVCGGAMRMITVVATKLGRSRRYKCTCGHTEDVKEDNDSRNRHNEVLDLEGFQELP
jgi:hypothetical protein